jgi:hypothetical protein
MNTIYTIASETIFFFFMYVIYDEITWRFRIKAIHQIVKKECPTCICPIMSNREPTDLDIGYTIGQLWLKITPPCITEMYIYDKSCVGVIEWKKIIEVVKETK